MYKLPRHYKILSSDGSVLVSGDYAFCRKFYDVICQCYSADESRGAEKLFLCVDVSHDDEM